MTTWAYPIVGQRGRQQTDATGNTTNANGVIVGDTSAGAVFSKDFYVYQASLGATGGVMPTYVVGVNGTAYDPVTAAVTVPNQGQSVLITLPAGSNIVTGYITLLQAPTAITTGALNVNLVTAAGNVQIGSFTIGTTLGEAVWTTPTTLVPLQRQSYTGNTDLNLSLSLAGTGITGGILAQISIVFVGKRADGSVNPQGGANDSGLE